MPETIGEHGLYCPDFDDYAAVALYMQDLGTRIDAALQEQLDALEAYQNRPLIVMFNPAIVNIAALGSAQNVFSAELFNNAPTILTSSTVGSVTTVNIGSPAGTVNPVTYPRGVWRFGATCRQTSVGATDALSDRELFILLTDDVISAPLDNAYDITYASTTGGSEGNLVHDQILLTGTHGVRMTHRVSNANSSSSVNIEAEGLWWLTYEGPTDIIEVA